jgi:hypothetical protein
MLKAFTKYMFDMVAALTIIVAVFYVAAITHILPLPESALTRLSGFSSNVMDVLFACGSWVIRHVADWKRIVKDGKGQAAQQRRGAADCGEYCLTFNR